MTRFTVTHPNGTQSVRTSKTMTYTHAVVAAVTGEWRATRAAETAAYHEAQAEKYANLVRTARSTATAADREYVARHQAHAAEYRAEEAHERTTPTTYGVVRWSQTQQAAEKDARSRQAPGYTATVVPVD